MGWRDGAIREAMAAEMAGVGLLLAESIARVFATEVIEATFRVAEEERTPPDTVALLGDDRPLVVIDNVGDVRTD